MAATKIIGEILLEFISSYFNIEVEDYSEKLIASDILKLHSQIFREEKKDFFNELEKSANLFQSEFSVEFPITKKSVEKKIMLNKEKKEKEDKDKDKENNNDYNEEESENEDSENEESENLNKISNLNINNNTNGNC